MEIYFPLFSVVITIINTVDICMVIITPSCALPTSLPTQYTVLLMVQLKGLTYCTVILENLCKTAESFKSGDEDKKKKRGCYTVGVESCLRYICWIITLLFFVVKLFSYILYMLPSIPTFSTHPLYPPLYQTSLPPHPPSTLPCANPFPLHFITFSMNPYCKWLHYQCTMLSLQKHLTPNMVTPDKPKHCFKW